ERAATGRGLDRIAGLVEEEDAELVVVGLPLTLGGGSGAQADETRAFVRDLAARVDVPVDVFDERFTPRLAEQSDGAAAEQARAAALLRGAHRLGSGGGG